MQEDVGGGCNARGLQVNDMVLMVNSKAVGGMTEDDLEVELEISGEELTLVISQYNGGPMKGQALDNETEAVTKTWCELDKGAFDWQELGPGSSSKNIQHGSISTQMGPPTAAGRSSAEEYGRSSDPTPKDAGGGPAPDVLKLRRETFRAPSTHNPPPPAKTQKETAPSNPDAKKTLSINSHPIGPTLPKEKPEEQARSVKNVTSDCSDMPLAGSGKGIGEDSHQAREIDAREDSYKFDTSRGIPQGDGEESTDGGAEAAPGLSLSRIMADFSICTSKKKRNSEQGRQKAHDGTTKGSSDGKGTPSTTSTDIRAREVIAEWNAEGGDGDDPELGCICGDIHEEPEPVFWLHCDICESWYNNSVRCLGFDQEAADKLKEWTCASCGGNPAIPHEGTKKIPKEDEG